MTATPSNYTIAMDLLGVLSILLGFLGFFCSLRFSKPWTGITVCLFRITVLVVCVSIVTTGGACLYFINRSPLTTIDLLRFAQRSDKFMDFSTASFEAGKLMHSSKHITISEPKAR